MTGKDHTIKRILFADDDKEDRLLFAAALKETHSDAILTVAENGVRVLQLLQKQLPDLILLDLNMPFKNGHECLEEIKNNEVLKHLPVVILSTSFYQQAVDTAYKQGANLYAAKPSKFDDLVRLIKGIISLNWNEYLPQPAKDKFIYRVQEIA